MKEKLIGQQDRPIYFIKKAMDSYCDALAQEAQCLDLRKKILSNRALINLWLKNYGKVVEDCIDAISIDPTFISPYVRGTEALVKLEKYDKAIQLAGKGLSQDSKNKVLLELKGEAESKFDASSMIELNKQKALKKKKNEIIQTCLQKGVYIGALSDFVIPEVYVREIKLFDEKIVTPVIFMYPEFAQFDFVEEASEDIPLWEIFAEIFTAGLPWDQNGFYQDPNDLRFYIVVKLCSNLKEKSNKIFDKASRRMG